MNLTPYDRPPITEAVIAVNFEMPLETKDIKKANVKFHRHYPQHQDVQNINLKVAVNAEGQGNTDGTEIEKGHRRFNADMNELLVMWHSSFIVSQLAPYPGWDVFFSRFTRDWKIWKRAVGFRDINRIGVRFINRIDIPTINDAVQHEAYLEVYPKLPSVLEKVNAYAVQAVVPLDDIECNLTLNSASIPSPILEHGSFLLDFDIARTTSLPQKDQDIFDLLNQIRIKKNEVFESCVTDTARRLF